MTCWRVLAAGMRRLLSPGCQVCRGPGPDVMCQACLCDVRSLRGPLCSGCSQPVGQPGSCARCRVRRPQFDGVRCAYEHRGPLRIALNLLKFKRRRALAAPLATLLQRAAGPLDDVDVIIPVPLHPRRRRQRGYNQAALLAEPVARAAGLPVREDLLVRTRLTPHQYQGGSAHRRANVASAFEAAPQVDGLRVLLVDDIMTTGATLDACASALRQSGARTVRALTLTRTVAQNARHLRRHAAADLE